MMQAHELRIGNYIYNPVQKINFKVDLQTLGNIINDNLKRSKKNEKYFYKPIPLTEEILLKCGFEKPINSNWCSKNGFEIDLSESVPFYIVFKNDFGNKVYLEYLHQLQNLYFALTGKELEIKL